VIYLETNITTNYKMYSLFKNLSSILFTYLENRKYRKWYSDHKKCIPFSCGTLVLKIFLFN
jgi:hypothetical protein